MYRNQPLNVSAYLIVALNAVYTLGKMSINASILYKNEENV